MITFSHNIPHFPVTHNSAQVNIIWNTLLSGYNKEHVASTLWTRNIATVINVNHIIRVPSRDTLICSADIRDKR